MDLKSFTTLLALWNPYMTWKEVQLQLSAVKAVSRPWLVERKLFYTWVTATFGAFEEPVSIDVLEHLMPHGKPDAYVAKVVQHWRTGKRCAVYLIWGTLHASDLTKA